MKTFQDSYTTYMQAINIVNSLFLNDLLDFISMTSTSPPTESQTMTIFVNPFTENMTGTMNFAFKVMIDAFEMGDFVVAFSDNSGISLVAYTILMTYLDCMHHKRIHSPVMIVFSKISSENKRFVFKD